MTRALLDTNVVLDYVQDRVPFNENAAAQWQAAIVGRFDAFMAAITPVNVYYIVRKANGPAAASLTVSTLLSALGVCPIDRAVLRIASALPIADFEDAVQVASAVAAGIDVVVTRDLRDFRGSTLPVLSPAAFLEKFLS